MENILFVLHWQWFRETSTGRCCLRFSSHDCFPEVMRVCVNPTLLTIWTYRELRCLENPLFQCLRDAKYDFIQNILIYLVPLCSVRLRFSASSFCLRASSSCVSFCFSCVDRLCPALTSTSGVCRVQRRHTEDKHSTALKCGIEHAVSNFLKHTFFGSVKQNH